MRCFRGLPPCNDPRLSKCNSSDRASSSLPTGGRERRCRSNEPNRRIVPLSYHDIPRRLYQDCDRLLLALDELLGGPDEDDLFQEPRSAQPEVITAAIQRVYLAVQILSEQRRVSTGLLAEGRLQYSCSFANVFELRGPGIRCTDCNICHEAIDKEAPSVTHENCMNTFCKEDWDAWVRHNPTCPTCRAELAAPHLSLLLKSEGLKLAGL